MVCTVYDMPPSTIRGREDRLRNIIKELRHLAWFHLDSDPGREYWAAMELMGRYASANHALIHLHIAKALKAKVLLDIAKVMAAQTDLVDIVARFDPKLVKMAPGHERRED